MQTHQNYHLSPVLRIIIICIILIASFLSVLVGFPVARLLGLSPADFGGTSFQPTVKTISVVVIFAAFQFFLIWSAMHFIHKGSFKTLGFKGKVFKPLLIGTVIGIMWQALEYLLIHISGGDISIKVCIPENVSIFTMAAYMLFNFLFLLTLNSLKEELVFRTYPIEQFNDYPNLMIPIIVLVSLVFAAVHHILVPFKIDAFMSRFTIALVLSFVYFKWRSIWFIAGIHNGLNLLVYLFSGNYKMGGLLNLTIANATPKGTSVLIDIITATTCILIFNYIWKIERRRSKSFFPVQNQLFRQ